MSIQADEQIKRLGAALAAPITHVGRRTAKVGMASATSLKMSESVEILVPELRENDPPDVTKQIVSVGLFSKSFRLPDLRASSGGHRVVVLSRNERERVLSAIFLSQFLHNEGLASGIFPTDAYAKHYSLDSALARGKITQDNFDSIWTCVSRIISAPPAMAQDILRGLQRDMDSWGLHWLAWRREFFEELRHFAYETQLLVAIKAAPGDNIVIDLEYSLPAPTSFPWADFELGDRPPKRFFQPIRSLLRILALTPWAVAVEVPAADHCESFHVIASCPTSASIEDIYWEIEQDGESGQRRSHETRFQRGSSGWLDMRWDDSSDALVRRIPRFWFGVHPMRRQVAAVGAILSTLTAIVLFQVARFPGTLTDLTSRTFLLTLPGVLTAGVSQTRSAGEMGLGAVPRGLLYLVASTPFVVAAVELFGDTAEPSAWSQWGAALTAAIAVLLWTSALSPRAPFFRRQRFSDTNARRNFYRLRDAFALIGLVASLVVFWIVFSTSGAQVGQDERPAITEGSGCASSQVQLPCELDS